MLRFPVRTWFCLSPSSFFVQCDMENNIKTHLILIYFIAQDFKFLVCSGVYLYSCHLVLIWYLQNGLSRKLRCILFCFPTQSCAERNQHGSRRYDNLQNWLDVTSHESLLWSGNNYYLLLTGNEYSLESLLVLLSDKYLIQLYRLSSFALNKIGIIFKITMKFTIY